MPSCLLVALPVLLWSTCALAAAPVKKEGVGALRIEVGAEDTGALPIHIGPGVSTTLLFDTDIQQDQVSLESRAQFARVSTGSAVLVLIPSNDLPQGGSLKLSIPFKDAGSTLPSRLSLTLVVDSGSVDRQVEVYRRARSAESYRLEVQQLRTELERLRQESASFVREKGEQPGLRGLLMSAEEPPGLAVLRVEMQQNCKPPCLLLVEKSYLYSSGARLAVMLLLRSADKMPWRIGRAVLVDQQGKKWESMPPAQSGPITAGAEAKVVLEFDVNNPPTGRYQLNVSDVEGNRAMQWNGLKFP
ncbi:DUF2381 family protein [Corallococcus exercitus]|uniref:DUF2381 family protein n=1 Tax=Corallococcus exercitus TaxID=2316736 RepID=UPI000EA0EDA8|nr:DUF2381 family protein [Corallococcus exercitus]RKG75227.1 DUF2381 family protein [Corallococcus exercitus]